MVQSSLWTRLLGQQPAQNSTKTGAHPTADGSETVARIKACRQSKSPQLNLSGLGLRTIPPGLGDLHHVKLLYLSGNQLAPGQLSALARLPSLQHLHLRQCNLTDAELEGLTGVRSIQHLDISSNALSDIAAVHLSKLGSLISLDISANAFTSASANYLAQLSELMQLRIDQTNINVLTPLVKLKHLRILSAQNIQFAAQFPEVWQHKSLNVALLHGSQLPNVPTEVLSRYADDDCLPRLRQYFAAREKAPDEIIRDVKVMLLGNGRVGKTQARRRLQGQNFEARSVSTHGVEILNVNLEGTPSEEPIPLRVWDFGGQDIYLGTHALFLKTRAVFPIFWTPEFEVRDEHEHGGFVFRNYPLREWLRYVRELTRRDPESGKSRSPVLLVQTRCEHPDQASPPPLSAEDLAGFTIPPQTLTYSAMDDQPQEGIQTALRQAAAELAKDGPAVLPGTWAAVKRDLEQMTSKGAKLISMADYTSACKRQDVNEGQQQLLELLHEFGVVFHDPNVSMDRIILDQNWALQAIYAVFDRDKGAYESLKGANRGRFRATDLARLVWSRDGYNEEAQAAFLSMMLSCQVAFVLRPDDTYLGEALYIAPDLLPERGRVEDEIPAFFDSNTPSETAELRYSFAAPSFLRALIGHWGAQAGVHALYWREGLAFYDRSTQARAILEMERPNPHGWGAVLRIATQNGECKALLERIQSEVATIAAKLGAALESSQAEAPSRSRAPVMDNPVIGEIVFDAPVSPGPEPLVRERCFISYAHQPDNEPGETAEQRAAYFKAVEARLDKLELEAFVDRKNLRNGELVSKFMKEGAQSPKIVVILCQKYLRSEFCMNELWWIWQACQSDRDIFADRVRAVCLPDASIGDEADRERVCMAWETRRQKIVSIIQERQDSKLVVPDEYHHTQNLAVNLVQHAPTILAALSQTLHIRRVEDVSKLRFAA